MPNFQVELLGNVPMKMHAPSTALCINSVLRGAREYGSEDLAFKGLRLRDVKEPRARKFRAVGARV